jgi:hypothetical protein
MARACLAGESGGALGLRWQCHSGSLELGQPAARSPRGFCSTGSRRRGGPIHPTSGKGQAVEAAGVDRAARAELGVIGGALRPCFLRLQRR